jgi:hypothetical protein
MLEGERGKTKGTEMVKQGKKCNPIRLKTVDMKDCFYYFGMKMIIPGRAHG